MSLCYQVWDYGRNTRFIAQRWADKFGHNHINNRFYIRPNQAKQLVNIAIICGDRPCCSYFCTFTQFDLCFNYSLPGKTFELLFVIKICTPGKKCNLQWYRFSSNDMNIFRNGFQCFSTFIHFCPFYSNGK